MKKLQFFAKSAVAIIFLGASSLAISAGSLITESSSQKETSSQTNETGNQFVGSEKGNTTVRDPKQKSSADKREQSVREKNSCLLYTSPSPRDA